MRPRLFRRVIWPWGGGKVERLKSQKGAAAVEFAIIAPLLLVMLFGIIEFSILLYDKAMLTNASREGARAGIVFTPEGRDPTSTITQVNVAVGNINDKIDIAVTTYCANHLISFGNNPNLLTTTTWVDNNGDGVLSPGDSFNVEVTYNYNFLVFSNLIGIFGGGFSDILNLKAITIMRLE